MLRQQRDVYAKEIVVMQDKLGQLGKSISSESATLTLITAHAIRSVSVEHCSKCEEALRDAYVSRLGMARLQARLNKILIHKESPKTHRSSTSCLQEQEQEQDQKDHDPADSGLQPNLEENPNLKELGVLENLLSDLAALKRRLEYYRQGFVSVQADNKGNNERYFVTDVKYTS